MTCATDSDRVMPVHDLRDFFRESIDAAIEHQGVTVDPHASHYVVNLLTLFSRSEHFYEEHGDTYGLRPLALMLADAADAPTPTQRNESLQRIGDVSLFVAGFFAEGLAAQPVDIDYYINMGGNAYGSLSVESRSTFRGRALAGVYKELARKFQVVVDLLNEVRDGVGRSSDIDLIRVYDIWRKTGSQRAAEMLKQNGVVPMHPAPGFKRH